MIMSNKLDNLEIVHEGWLTKSPPTTRIWRARWRRRWFILRHSGELPGQYFLCYYTDRNCRKLKGHIDLDQCEQVDAGLRFENRKQKYQFLFNIRTPKRMYYLAAETEDDMNKWVDCVCHVCGLKPFVSEDVATEYEGDNISEATTRLTEISPPVTPHTVITGPYIPISECISGRPVTSLDDFRQFLLLQQVKPKPNERESYDMPRQLRPTPLNVDTCTPPPSPGSESVFTDDDESVMTKPTKKPTVNWETFPRQSESSLEEESQIKVDRRYTKSTVDSAVHVPPRPPKPPHLVLAESTESKNMAENRSPVKIEVIGSDDMYDIPRSHQIEQENTKGKVGRHCYTNAAPSEVSGNIFRYDFSLPVAAASYGEFPESPRSETSSITSATIVYSNLPSPSYSTASQVVPIPPPAVNRELKPGRKCSDSTAGSNEPSPSFYGTPPNIDRNLKPGQLKKAKESLKSDNVEGVLKLSFPPTGSLGRRKQRIGPHTTTPSSAKAIYDNGFLTTARIHRRYSSSDDRIAPADEQVQFYQVDNYTFHTRSRHFGSSKRFDEIQYLDLDLDSTVEGPPTSPNPTGLVKKSSENLPTPSTATVYKTVDFLKTEAFNRTRIEIEEERSRLAAAELS